MTFTPLPPVSFDLSTPPFDAAARQYVATVSGVIGGEQIKSFRLETQSPDASYG